MPNAKQASQDTVTVMSAQEVADFLGVHLQTVYQFARDGDIPNRRIGRRFIFTRESLAEWLRMAR